MKKYSLTLLMLLSFMAQAGYGSGSDDVFGAATACEKDPTKRVTFHTSLPDGLEVFPRKKDYFTPKAFLTWLKSVADESITITELRSVEEIPFDDFLNYCIQKTKTAKCFEVPKVGEQQFGLSRPFTSKSGACRRIFNIPSNKLRGEEGRTLNVLNLGAGHGFFELSLFASDAPLFVSSMELNPELVTLFNTHTKPMLRSMDEAKAEQFMMLQGDARDPSHPFFQLPENDMVIALNLLHYLDIKDWPQVLSNMHSALKDDGFAVFSMGFNEAFQETINDQWRDVKALVDSAIASGVPRNVEDIKKFFREEKAIKWGAEQDEVVDMKVSAILKGPLFPIKRKWEEGRGVFPTAASESPGTYFPDGSFIAPYTYNLSQAIHCIEHTKDFRVQSYVIVGIGEEMISREFVVIEILQSF